MGFKTVAASELDRPSVREELAAAFACGAVAAFPTETFYGLGGDPRQPAAVDRLVALKERGAQRAMPLIAADRAAVERWTAPASPAEAQLLAGLARAFWPGPLSLVVTARPGLAAGAVAADGTLAVRISGLPLARRLAALAGGLLVATSANRSGQPPATGAARATAGLAGEIDILIDGGETPGGSPSTLLSILGGRPRILREGAIAAARIETVLAAQADL